MIVKEVAKSVSKWKKVARSFDLKEKEIEQMGSAFEHADLSEAKKL